MSPLLISVSGLSVLLAIVMTVVASKLLRQNRTRSAARIAALQALVHDAPARSLTPDLPDETFDLALRQTADSAQVKRRLGERPEAATHPLFEAPTPRTPGRRWTWMAAAGLVMASAAGVFYVVSSGVIGRVIAANEPKPVVASASPIELLSLRHSIDPTGNFIVTGLVQNPAVSTSLRGVFAVVYLFDAEGRYFASSRAALESAVLSPGGEAAFVVRVPASSSSSSSDAADVSRYRVSFQQEDGAAVSHVDRRGSLPERTTGDTVETPPAATSLVTARKN